MKARVNSHNNAISNNLIRKRIQTIAQENGLSEQVRSVLVNLFNYMIAKSLYGGCHALSSVLYVALREIGESPQLCIGECFNPKENAFDHSWITLNDKIIDLAIYMPLSHRRNTVTGVVIMDIDTATKTQTNTKYGYATGSGFGCDAKNTLHTPFVEYMNAYPLEHNGLWNVVKIILPDAVDFDIDKAKTIYANTKRVVCGQK